MADEALRIALVGNPNCGKTTLFNRMTGSRGKVGNLPGVTVGATAARLRGMLGWELVDLPGTYSLYAEAPDEQVTQQALLDPNHRHRPDVVALVLDSSQVRSGLFLVLQVLEWGLPSFVWINDTVEDTEALGIDVAQLSAQLGVPVLRANFVKTPLSQLLQTAESGGRTACVPNARATPPDLASPTPRTSPISPLAQAWKALRAVCPPWNEAQGTFVLRRGTAKLGGTAPWVEQVNAARVQLAADAGRTLEAWTAQVQLEEAGERMARIRAIAAAALPPVPEGEPIRADIGKRRALWTTRLDTVLTHPIAGQIILAAVFFCIFQAVYAWAAYPMDWVDATFSAGIASAQSHLPETWWTSLLLDGVLSGIAGIVVFVPQIMILFGLTAALDATGYMARVGFLGDRFLQRLGLNGRSIVPLVGGMACAIPAVMAARSIPGKRERLLTILVTPLMTCSARLPVYAFLIGFLVPDTTVGGLFNLPGLFLFGLYVASTLAALGMAWLLHRGLPRRTEGGYTVEWPAYRWPRPKDILVEMGVRGWSFVSSAGQVILVVSMVLWALARFGPSEDMDSVRSRHAQASTVEQQAQRDADLLQASYIGHISRAIEPWVRPLGYDGTLGIALLTSFAAREVFVGTLSTLYPTAGSETGNIQALQERMTTERNPHTGKPLLQPATALSLLVFYMFAMQCMSTVAVVQRELKSWTWALGQALAFTTLAYLFAWVVFQVFS